MIEGNNREFDGLLLGGGGVWGGIWIQKKTVE
jgi:hypothetical protein